MQGGGGDGGRGLSGGLSSWVFDAGWRWKEGPHLGPGQVLAVKDVWGCLTLIWTETFLSQALTHTCVGVSFIVGVGVSVGVFLFF